MTLQVTECSKEFIGAGTVGPFTWTWRFFDNSHISAEKVSAAGVVTPLVETTDYTLTGADSYQGGTLTLLVALAVGETLYVERNTPAIQEIDLRNQGDFFPETYEDALDYGMAIKQEQRRNESLALRMTPPAAGISPRIPLPVAGEGIRWNSEANAFEAVGINAEMWDAEPGARSAADAAIQVQIDANDDELADHEDRVSRSLKLPAGDTTDPTVPNIATRANKALGFDLDGAPVAFDIAADLSGYAISKTPVADALPQYGADGSLQGTNIVHRVDTVAALRLITGSSGRQAVQVLGYYAPGDGGGGPVRQWSSGKTVGYYTAVTGTEPDNGGSIIVPTGGDGSAAWVWGWSGPVNLLWFGARGDGVTNDTPAAAAAYAFVDAVFWPTPTVSYSVDSISLGAGKSLLTPGVGTIIQQRTGNVGTRVLYITGSNVTVGDLTIQGNIATDTDEQNHGIFIRGTVDITGISIGNIVGKDLRGDVIYVGGLATAGVFDVSISSVFADNVLRNGISVTGGQGVKVGSVTGTAVGFLMFDVEPNANSQQTDSIRVDYIRGGASGVIGYSSTVVVTNVTIGTLDLDSSYQPNSTPAYGLYNVSSAFQARSARGLHVGSFTAKNYTSHAFKYVYDGPSGDVKGENIVFDWVDWLNCSTTEVVYATAVIGAFKDFTINGGTVIHYDATKFIVFGDAATPANVKVSFRNIYCNGRVAKFVGYSQFDNITVNTSEDIYVFQYVFNSVVSRSNITAGRLAGYSSNIKFEKVIVNTTGVIFDTSNSNHFIEDSTLNGVYYQSDNYQPRTSYPTTGLASINNRAKRNPVAVGSPIAWVCTVSGGNYSTTRADLTAVAISVWGKWTSGTTVWEATTAGTTGASPPSIVGLVVGDTVADGTVVWTMRSLTAATWISEGNL